MKKTFTTVMPDKVGAFLVASEIMTELGLNITRVSYNKAIDTHMLFIEAEGTAESLKQATLLLKEKGYLHNQKDNGNIILLEFNLRDVPGSVKSVLSLIGSFNFNISYISSQENGTEYQHFRMGLFIENGADISQFIRQASELCDVRIINYDPTETVLDNTVFYMSFANKIADKNNLNEENKKNLIVNSNLIMELLNERKSPPYKTFDYIGKFADKMAYYRGNSYVPRESQFVFGNIKITLLEPPCGSNICIIDSENGLLAIDSGFACFKEESLKAIKRIIPDFDSRKKDIVITHTDVDHCGMLDCFDRIFLSKKAKSNFEAEYQGLDCLREKNQIHAPYVRISKILSAYKPPQLDKLCVIGGTDQPLDKLIEHIGILENGELTFDVYEGSGGHVLGEIILVERRLHIVFTGDIFINIKELSAEQTSFNRIAPFLMTSVDSIPKVAEKERKELLNILGSGEWLIFGGHGAAKKILVENNN